MTLVEAAADHPELVVAWLVAFVISAAMIVSSRYRIRIKRKDFELVVEPHGEKRGAAPPRGTSEPGSRS